MNGAIVTSRSSNAFQTLPLLWRSSMAMVRIRCELVVVADESHAGSPGQCVADDGVQFDGAGFAGFVDDQQGARANGVEPFAGGDR
jgi:hypothetical protein